MLLMEGFNVAFAAKQMGHSKVVFMRTYADWIDGTEIAQRENARLANAFGPKVVPQQRAANDEIDAEGENWRRDRDSNPRYA